MAWVKIDDNAPHHRKMLLAGPIACWLWVCGLAYANRHATDGLIPAEALPFLGCKDWHKAVPRLTTVGLWIADGPTGYRIHDFLHWNDSAATRKAKAAETASRVAKFREGKKATVKRDGNAVTDASSDPPCNATPKPTPQPLPQPKETSSKNDDVVPSAGRGFPLAMSPLRYEKLKQSFRHVGARLRVPHVLHDELVTKLGGDDPDAALVGWYGELDTEIERTKAPIPDVFMWLRPKFVEWSEKSAEDAAWAETLRIAAEQDAADAAAKAVRRG